MDGPPVDDARSGGESQQSLAATESRLHVLVVAQVLVGAAAAVISVGVLLTTAILVIARCLSVRICIAAEAEGAAQRLQFTIRQLLLLTFAVACMAAIGKWLASWLETTLDPLLVAGVGVLFGCVGVMCAWLILRGTNVVLASVVAIAAAAGMGFGFARWLCSSYYRADELFWVSCTSAEAVLLVASLICIRSWGYRIVQARARECGVAER
jgi:hypothetical protein